MNSKLFVIYGLILVALVLSGCEKKNPPQTKTSKTTITNKENKMDITKESFGQVDGKEVFAYTLTNANALKAKLMTYGGILISLEVPDKNGQLADIVLGYDNVDDYVKLNPYFGALIGRFGNRIGKGRFTLDGVDYQLATNDGENHLHGGLKGFDKVIWNAEEVKTPNAVGVKFTYLSKDGEENYPGNLKCTVIYTLTNDNELKIEYEAETDKATPINLTHHSYFNLNAMTDNVLSHELTLTADNFTPVDAGLIPTGEIAPVKGGPMDFTSTHTIGERIDKVTGGYDHNYVLNNSDGSLALAATVTEPTSGRVMEILTTEPGIQFYSGNFLDGAITGKDGIVYKKHYGFCLETQHFPDSPNKPNFPSCILRPGEKYTQVTIHKFYAK
ncbi:MAG: galactose mutarotase [Sedimentisphaerales bacterium]|nr:galactose mutarotase [Sedimentisphaerales bacterium]